MELQINLKLFFKNMKLTESLSSSLIVAVHVACLVKYSPNVILKLNCTANHSLDLDLFSRRHSFIKHPQHIEHLILCNCCCPSQRKFSV